MTHTKDIFHYQIQDFFFFLPFFSACRILVPWSGIELGPHAEEVWILNHWTAWEVPRCLFCSFSLFLFLFFHPINSSKSGRLSFASFLRIWPFCTVIFSLLKFLVLFLCYFFPRLICSYVIASLFFLVEKRNTCFLTYIKVSASQSSNLWSWDPLRSF